MNINFDNNTGLMHNIFKPVWLITAIFIYSATITLSNLILIKPQLKQYKLLEAKKNELDEVFENVQVRNVDETIKFLESEIDFYKNEQKIFKSKILNRQNISFVLGELTRIVNTSGLSLNYIDPLPASSNILKDYQKLPITLRISGTYKDFLTFLKALDSAEYWLLIDSYNISNTKTLSKNSYTVNIYTIVE